MNLIGKTLKKNFAPAMEYGITDTLSPARLHNLNEIEQRAFLVVSEDGRVGFPTRIDRRIFPPSRLRYTKNHAN